MSGPLQNIYIYIYLDFFNDKGILALYIFNMSSNTNIPLKRKFKDTYATISMALLSAYDELQEPVSSEVVEAGDDVESASIWEAVTDNGRATDDCYTDLLNDEEDDEGKCIETNCEILD